MMGTAILDPVYALAAAVANRIFMTNGGIVTYRGVLAALDGLTLPAGVSPLRFAAMVVNLSRYTCDVHVQVDD